GPRHPPIQAEAWPRHSGRTMKERKRWKQNWAVLGQPIRTSPAGVLTEFRYALKPFDPREENHLLGGQGCAVAVCASRSKRWRRALVAKPARPTPAKARWPKSSPRRRTRPGLFHRLLTNLRSR